MAACSAGAAAREAANNRVYGHQYACGLGLRELGWVEGRTITIEYRWAESHNERFTEIAAEFTRLNVDLIVTAGAGIIAAKRATSTIPIVFALANDPVGAGLVASLARPGGNITGLSTQLADLPGKRLQLVRDLVPAVRRLGLMFNAGFPDAVLEMHGLEAAARAQQMEANPLQIRRPEDIPPSFVDINITRTLSTSALIHSCSHTGPVSSAWRWAQTCRHSLASASSPEREL